MNISGFNVVLSHLMAELMIFIQMKICKIPTLIKQAENMEMELFSPAKNNIEFVTFLSH